MSHHLESGDEATGLGRMKTPKLALFVELVRAESPVSWASFLPPLALRLVILHHVQKCSGSGQIVVGDPLKWSVKSGPSPSANPN